uniref:Carnitine O-acetyltransferase a n=1 Tax=Amphilophus citrinellus TaxID=61819 RepID=A0A3Q0RUN2_AMPCI
MRQFAADTLVKVGMGNPCGLVKSCWLSLVRGRYLNYWKGLPHLPVPPLRETCERYLSALEPIVKEDELKQTTWLMEEFLKEGGDGEKLQKSLERKACTTDNWLTDHGLQTQYLDSHAHRHKKFRVEYMRGEPLCMMQYCQALSSCCIPGLKTDSLVFHGKSSNAPKHITVAHNSQFFTVEVYNSDGTPITVDQLCVQLERICNSPLETNMELVGILTTLRRDSWAKWYDRLVQDPSNRESVSAIERSICMLCLDGAMPQVYGKSGRCAVLQMLHGGGSQWNSANRWFDKSLQFIIGEGGTCGLNILHAVIDGTASLALADHITASMKKPQMMPSPVELLPMPQKLHFSITPDIKNVIEEAKQSMDKIAEDLDLRVLVFSHFGKNFIKAHKLSPDAFVQMAIQLAYYRIYQQCCASYEAASMRLFRKGRLGVIISTSSASAAFVKSFDDPKNTEKLDLLEKAIKVHRWNTNMEIRGQIIYGHILALKNQAIEDDIPMPGIFTDPSLDKAFNFRLSTSQMSSKTGCLCFAGPDQPEVYDFCYSFTDDDITFVGSAWKSCKENNVIQLIQTLEDALLDMRMLLENETSSA